MLDLGGKTAVTGGVSPVVNLEESAAVLEAVLPYTYSNPVPPFKLEFPFAFSALKALDKYGVSTSARLPVPSQQRLNHNRADLARHRRPPPRVQVHHHTASPRPPNGSSCPHSRFYMMDKIRDPDFATTVFTYLFAAHVEDADLRQAALLQIVDAQPTVEALSDVSSLLQGHFKGDACQHLVRPPPSTLTQLTPLAVDRLHELPAPRQADPRRPQPLNRAHQHGRTQHALQRAGTIKVPPRVGRCGTAVEPEQARGVCGARGPWGGHGMVCEGTPGAVCGAAREGPGAHARLVARGEGEGHGGLESVFQLV